MFIAHNQPLQWLCKLLWKIICLYSIIKIKMIEKNIAEKIILKAEACKRENIREFGGWA